MKSRLSLPDTGVRPRRFAVRAGQNHEVAIGVAEPELAMGRAAGTVRRVAVRRIDDLSLQGLRPADGGVEVVDLKPKRYTVSVGPDRRVADPAVVVFDDKGMQLEYERAVAKSRSRRGFGAATDRPRTEPGRR